MNCIGPECYREALFAKNRGGGLVLCRAHRMQWKTNGILKPLAWRGIRNADISLTLCLICGGPIRASKYGICSRNRTCSNEVSRRDGAELKQKVLLHYGMSCACCQSIKDLTIDHITPANRQNLTGRALERTHGRALYQWLASNDFPEGYQTLCGPCNHSKAQTGECRLIHSENSDCAISIYPQNGGYAINCFPNLTQADAYAVGRALMAYRDKDDQWLGLAA